MRYFIRFSYDGSKFYGFQRQPDRKTIQGELERALSIIHKSDIQIKGAGRTDVGVHAYGQTAHFDFDFFIPENRLRNAINSIVHPYINILECKIVDDNFHARFDVKSKTYIYKLWLGEYDPLKSDYYYIYNNKINMEKIKECINLLKGKHDFHNFVSGTRDNSQMIIESIKVNQNDNELIFTFVGKSFYRYMVRNLVGAILNYNEGKCDLKLIDRMINDSNFTYNLETAPASGLYLMEVNY